MSLKVSVHIPANPHALLQVSHWSFCAELHEVEQA